MVLYGLAGLLVGYAFFSQAADPGGRNLPHMVGLVLAAGVGSILALFGVMLLSVTLHELGHVLLGAASGFQLHMLQVSNVGVRRHKKGWQFYFINSKFTLSGLAGMIPKKGRTPSLSIMILGGPLATATQLALILLLVPQRTASGELNLVWIFLMAASAPIAIGCLLPFKSGGMYTDMAILLLPLFDKKAASRLALLDLIGRLIGQHARPRTWPGEAIEELVTLAEGTPHALNAHLISGMHQLDLGNTDAAGEQFRLAVQSLGKNPVHQLAAAVARLDYAFHLAAYEGDLAQAQEQIELASNVGAAVEGSRRRALAALAWAEGDRLEAEAQRAAMAAYFEKCGTSEQPDVQAEIEWLDRVLQQDEGQP
jgi:MFS family permease